ATAHGDARDDRLKAEEAPEGASSRSLRSAGCLAVDVVRVLLLPREVGAENLAGRLDRVAGLLLTQLEELLATVVLGADEARGEGTVLDLGEHGLHALLDRRVDDARARDVVAVLGRVGDAPPLLGDAALPHQV